MRCGRTGGTKNGRPAFLKDNDTNHMLWFAHGADGPTWYVGKREEFGESRGWLQVKSDAMTPQDIKGTWQVWSTTEKMWKNCKEGDIKCVSVSATCGVIIVGATPNNLLQVTLNLTPTLALTLALTMEQAVQEKEEFGRILRVKKETTMAEETVRPALPLPLTPNPNPQP